MRTRKGSLIARGPAHNRAAGAVNPWFRRIQPFPFMLSFSLSSLLRHVRGVGLLVLGLSSVGLFPGRAADATGPRPPIVDGTILATARDGDVVYMAGRFEWAAVDTGYLVAYDKTTGAWKSNFPFVNGPVLCAISDDLGGFYIGGDFTEVGGLSRPRVAHILADGSVDAAFRVDVGLVKVEYVSYSTLGFRQNLSFTSVQNLHLRDGRLYIAGAFDRVGNQSRLALAAVSSATGAVIPGWQMDIWNEERLGQVVEFQAAIAGVIHQMASSSTELIVGGYFSHAGKLDGTPAQKVRRVSLARTTLSSGSVSSWDANLPIVVAPNQNVLITRVWGLGVIDNELYANGALAGSTFPLTDRFDLITGSKIAGWSPALGAGASWAATFLGAIGRRLVYQAINGTAWMVDRQIGALDGWKMKTDVNQANAALALAAIDGDQMWFAGRYTLNGALYDGAGSVSMTDGVISGWKPALPAISEAGDSARAPYTRATPAVLVGAMAGDYKCIVVAGNTVLLGGDRRAHGARPQRNILAWNAKTGALLPWRAPLTSFFEPGVSYSSNSQIRTVAVSSNRVFAGGDFRETGGTSVANQVHLVALDKTSGLIIGTWAPKANGPVNALFLSGDTLYAGGEFTQINGTTRYSLAAISATTGSLLPWAPESGGVVRAFAGNAAVLWAAGNFTTVNDQPRRGFAEFELATGALATFAPAFGPSPASRPPRTLALRGNTLYAGGDFDSIAVDGVSTSRLRAAAFDIGAKTLLAWNPRADAVVNSILPTDSGVWLAGKFQKLGPDDASVGRRFVGAVDDATGAVLADDPNRDGSALLRADLEATAAATELVNIGATALIDAGADVLAFGNAALTSSGNGIVIPVIEGGTMSQRVAGVRRFGAAQAGNLARTPPTLAQHWTPVEVNKPYTYTLSLPTLGLKSVTLSGLPPGLTFDPSTLTVSGTPVSLSMPSGIGLNPRGDADPTGTLLGKFAIEVYAVYNDGASKSACVLTIYQPGKLTGRAPAIVAQPVSRSIFGGQPASFSITVTGDPALFSYRWQQRARPTSDWLDKPNALDRGVTSTLSMGNTPLSADGSQFRCIVSNGVAPDATSDVVTLTVNETRTPPIITKHPRNVGIGVNGIYVTFAVEATGSGILRYQWQRQASGTVGFFDIVGYPYADFTTPVLKVGNISAAMNGDIFRCVVSNGVLPDAISNAASLSVPGGTAPQITEELKPQTVDEGISVLFNIRAGGVPSGFVYRWERLRAGETKWELFSDNPPYLKGITDSIRVETTAEMNGDKFRCIVSNGVPPDAISNEVLLTVKSIPQAPQLTGPADFVVVAPDAPATFEVFAFGKPMTFIYRWQIRPKGAASWSNLVNGAIYTDVNTASLTITKAVQAMEDDKFRCIVSNGVAPDATSNEATLLVRVVRVAPVVSGPPDVLVPPGTSATFAVSATGTPAVFSYRWQWRTNANAPWSNLANGAVYAGVNTATLVISKTTATMADSQFRCIVSNGVFPDGLSRTASLRVGQAPMITLQPAEQFVPSGTIVLFKVLANSDTTLTYRWERQTAFGTTWDAPIIESERFTGVNRPTLRVTSTMVLNGDRFRCVVTDSLGLSTTSLAATLGVNYNPNLVPIPGIAWAPIATGLPFAWYPTLNWDFFAFGVASSNSTIRAAATSPVVFNATGLPSWATIESATGKISGTPPVSEGGRVYVVALQATVNGREIGRGSVNLMVGTPGSDLRIVNLSTRARVGAGDDVLGAGFVMQGTAPRQFLLRAIGPTLANFNVASALENPAISLFDSKSVAVASNAGWGTGSAAAQITELTGQVGAFALSPTSKDAVLIASLNPGSQSALVRGANGSTGVVLLELYDATKGGSEGQMINISARALVPGGDTLIGGVVLAGGGSRRILVRAIGPTLANFGVSGVLADPQIELFAGQTLVSANDNWKDSDEADLIALAAAQAGAFSLDNNSKDACLIANLVAGSYSVVVTGKGATAGVCLIELYLLPEP